MRQRLSIQLFLTRFVQSFRRIFAQVRKELDWALHDRLSMAILFLLPIFLFAVMGGGTFSVGPTANSAVLYIVDLNDTEYSKAFIENFRGENFNFELHDSHSEPEVVSLARCEELIVTPLLDAYIVIPANFSTSLLLNRSAHVDLVIDSTSDAAILVKKTIDLGKLQYQMEYQVFFSEILYIPEMRPDEDFSFVILTLPVLSSMILFACVNMVVCQSVVADEPLKRLLLSPTLRGEVIISKTIAYSFFGAILAFLCLAVLWIFFATPFASFLNVFLISFFATFFGVTFGVLFSSVSKSRLQAAQMSIFMFALQFMIVQFLRIEPIVFFLPMEIIREVFVSVAFRNISLFQLPGAMLKIIGLNSAVIALSILIYKRKKFAV